MLPNDDTTGIALNVMKQGGQERAERAKDKWWSGDYLKDPEAIEENMARWRAVHKRIGELVSAMRSALESGQL